ncbi:SDR family NAD(P)-dependent oxidoreductase [Labrys wisconsinensis]|uniref:2-deoxy-D-gluconate 3-dehydrogenase n=1 Tax=Labrys wisconsinensis TaxID=425677 RepID=A0ABU0JF25_9HYPH|nr:glucose 1-dehydrogenase [Labrys wisconsinensis]MDQ0472886.1 2-deoxy-D-gluconate 3-dehydrogenase [Labrys wisconsinensis]
MTPSRHQPPPGLAAAFDLSGKVAIVTGGNGGIGLAIARGLAAAGAGIVIAGRSDEKNRRAERDLAEAGATVMALNADVTREEDCKRLAAEAFAAFGRIDILVNNAGTNVRKQPEEYSLEEWHMLLDANLTSAFLATMAVFPMMKRTGGKIINIGSMTSLFGAGFAAPYGASKGGVVQLTKALASAWAQHGIRVNAILPGWIETDLTIRGRAATPHLHDQVIARTPAGRWGRPDDLAAAAVFLAGPGSDFVTGIALPVDGGYAAQA